MTSTTEALTIVAAVGSALAGGGFLVFSSFVMPALDDLPPAQAIAAMHAVNRRAINPLFMLVLFGTGALCLGLGAWAAFNLGDDGAALVLLGAVAYVAGNVVVTMAANVPRNVALDQVQPDDPAAAEHWGRYLREWTAFNTVRAITGAAGAALLTAALVQA